MLIMGGDADPVCPPNQNTMLAEKIKEAGTTVDLKLYEGEGHMFLKCSTVRDMEVRREARFRKYLVCRSSWGTKGLPGRIGIRRRQLSTYLGCQEAEAREYT